MADNNNIESDSAENMKADTNVSEANNERFTEEQRQNMRSKVLGWLQSHPQAELKKPGNAVVVPKQKRHFKIKWPWSRAKNKISKPTIKPVHRIEQSVALPAKEEVKVEQTKSVSEVLSKPKEEPKEVETPHQTSTKEPVWPPKPVEQNSKLPVTSSINNAVQEIKHESLINKKNELIAPAHDALLTEGIDLISEDEHAKIIERVEEENVVMNDPKKNQSTSDTATAAAAPNERHSESKILKNNVSNLKPLSIYRTAWILFVIITLLGIFSPMFGQASLFSKISPAPYAIIGNSVVMRSTFDREINALQQFQKQQPSLKLTDDQLMQQVQTAIIRRTIANEMTRQENIWITQSEIDEELNKVITNAGSLEEVRDTIANLWGWSLDEYKRYIIRPTLTKKALQIKLSNDPVLQREVGQPGDINQFDRYLDSLRSSYRILIF